jgi:hypothetical protein
MRGEELSRCTPLLVAKPAEKLPFDFSSGFQVLCLRGAHTPLKCCADGEQSPIALWVRGAYCLHFLKDRKWGKDWVRMKGCRNENVDDRANQRDA